MKELEKAFGVYVSWNCSRLQSGDYVMVYTRTHDMSADNYTKGFDDQALFQRLLLLTNLYYPSQWKNNELKPAPLLGDKSSALGHPDFDDSLLNSQWPIFIMGGSETLEKRKNIKQNQRKRQRRGVHNLNAISVP